MAADFGIEDLKFEDVSPDKDIESGKSGKEQTHTFSNFPNQADSEDEEDKSNLLTGEKKQPSFWTFAYYQQFFDVDTRQVLMRILGSMIPNTKANYLQTKIRPNPDLYGPFWICATLVFTTAIAGNFANYIHYHDEHYEWKYDFHKVTFAATAIFCYWWLVPSLLWAVLWWRGNQAGLTFLEIICIYGYSLAIYVPISILWVIPSTVLQWILVMLGMALSGSVLVLTFWPVIREDNRKVAIVMMTLIVLFHGALAVGFVLYFFSVPYHDSSSESPSDLTNSSALAAGGDSTVEKLQDVTHTLAKATQAVAKLVKTTEPQADNADELAQKAVGDS